mmetsp:Transcript_31259/g.77436  ORF Transcript_31259/g.77436 Transcript_31259/m.77436 type:complete len:320 (+) Transcript_31259:906-1865(+)
MILVLNYILEVQARKDFLLAKTVIAENARSDALLLNILPKHVVQKFMTDSDARLNMAEAFDEASILFSDIVGFTVMSSRISPIKLVALLNKIFVVFDGCAAANGLEKIKTIGDAYMAAGGVPLPSDHHARDCCRMALQMIVAMKQFRNDLHEQIQIRIGVHSGNCVAGVIVTKKFTYDVWGDAINTASRMESHGEPSRVHISESTYKLIQQDFECEDRGTIYVKGKGEMRTYFVLSERQHSLMRRRSSSRRASARKRSTASRGGVAISLEDVIWEEESGSGDSDSATDEEPPTYEPSSGMATPQRSARGGRSPVGARRQ